MLMRFLIIIGIISLMMVAGCGEDTDFLEADPFGGVAITANPDPGPVVFPKEMPPAANEIVQIVAPIIQQVADIFCPQCAAEEDAVQAKNRAFLGNDTGNISINFTA